MSRPLLWTRASSAAARATRAHTSLGGHFAALEEPELLADEIRAFFRPLRHSSG